MTEQLEATGRAAVLVEDAALIRMMGLPSLQALASRSAPYEQVDPFILVHEARLIDNGDSPNPSNRGVIS